MFDNSVPTFPNRTGSAQSANISRVLLDMAIAFGPLFTIGAIGERVGDGTALGAVLVNLVYVLSLVFATVALKRRGSGWRQIGLARPHSWTADLVHSETFGLTPLALEFYPNQ